MSMEYRQYRRSFLPTELVQLRQVCLTPGRLFEPGKYIAGDLPDIAFELGLVDGLPPVRGKHEQIGKQTGEQLGEPEH